MCLEPRFNVYDRSAVLMKKVPSIDLGRCSECEGCIEIAPAVFRYNSSTGMMEVIEQDEYPEDLVNEAIKNCPEDCISWELDDYPKGKSR
jgi:ferredoxin